MVKKTKKETYVIKEVLLKGWRQKKIAKLLNLSKLTKGELLCPSPNKNFSNKEKKN